MVKDLRSDIKAAIEREEPIRFAYLKRGNILPEYRTVSVFELSDSGDTFLSFDHGRQGLRRFDAARIMGDLRFVEDEDYIYPIEREAQ